MNNLKHKHRVKYLAYSIICILPILLLLLILGLLGFRVNFTSSMPVGIWHRTSINPAEIHKKDIVLFCLSLENEAGKFAIEQGYFARGSCPGNIAPLLKPIIAESGDIINLTTEFVAINGKQIINSQTYSYDSSGMRLSVFPRGKYVVKTGEFWVIGSEHDRSFDSRYFGAIKANQIIGIMNLVWLWN